MPTEGVIEQRLAAVEAAIADIRQRLEQSPSSPHWVERFRGAFEDEPAFAEVVSLGRALREADRPNGDQVP